MGAGYDPCPESSSGHRGAQNASARWWDRRDLKPGEHIQGCLTREGAYAVMDLDVRVV